MNIGTKLLDRHARGRTSRRRPAGRTAATLGALIAVLAALPGVPAFGQVDSAAPGSERGVRPGAGGPPTTVRVGMHLVDLSTVDDVQQTLTANIVIRATWTDHRLAPLEGRTLPLDEVWSPGLAFVNSGRTFPDRPDRVSVGSGGLVTYVQRYEAIFATHHSLADFPFDEQAFRISMRSIEWPEDEVALVVDEAVTGRREVLNVSDWRVLDVGARIEREYGEAYGAHFHRFDFRIEADRLAMYYVWKVIFPLCLIVAMSWLVFWLQPEHSSTQISLSATSMLTLIAFLFATTNMVPKLGYFTRLDTFIVGSTAFVFLALLQSVSTGLLVSRGAARLAHRLDAWCRVLFPVLYAAFGLGALLR